MLTYAFQELRQNNYEKISGEDFDNIHDLFAEILARGIAFQLKQGLHRKYISKHETTTSPRGKLNINNTVRNLINRNQKLDCDYDELSEDNLFNQVLKTTSTLLIKHSEVKAERKATLKQLMLFFSGVSTVEPKTIKWSSMRFDRNSKTYKMLLFLCYFIFNNMLLTTESGEYAMHTFSDEHMCRLYEKFILEYYKRHHPECKPRAVQIKWNLDLSATSTMSLAVLPIMQTDIFLEIGERTLIIDAKYYGQSLVHHIDKDVIHSPNFYQIHSYVMNHDSEHKGRVDGMLLYVQTQNDGQLDFHYPFRDGNVIYIRSLDLKQDFEKIKEQLDGIVSL
jgi:5-methylcytosine-specific restriction enzyme subunit McrC